MFLRKKYIEAAASFAGKNIVKVFTGLRRSGKSCIMQMMREKIVSSGIPPERTVSINFESRANDFHRSADSAYRYVKEAFRASKGAKLYLFLDEIQELAGWEKFVNAIAVDFDVDVYLTGSNANLLSGELATHLGGRYVEIPVYPLSFSEYAEWRGMSADTDSRRRAFRDFIREGGMPFLRDASLSAGSARQYLSDIFGSVVVKDIVMRRKIREAALLENVLSYIVSETGHLFSPSSVSKFLKSVGLKVAPETLYNYVRYGEESCLFIPMRRNDIAGKQLLSRQEKIFIADHGFREALAGGNDAAVDQVLENIVAVELVRRGYSVTVGTAGAREIDFVAEKHGERVYVQVAYLIDAPETREREFSALEGVPDNFPKFVVSMDELDFSRNGIKHMAIWEFLSSEAF